MNRHRRLIAFAGAILVVLTALYVNTGRMAREREEEIARNLGNDALIAELEDYRGLNERQQTAILVLGGVVWSVAGTWLLITQTRRSHGTPPINVRKRMPSN